MRFDVTYEDGTTVTVEPGPADVVALEKDQKASLGALIRTGSPQWSYFLAWHKLSRRGEGRTFDTWLDQVISITDSRGAAVEPGDGDDAEDPTTGAPASAESAPVDSSPPSPSEQDSDTTTS